MKVTISKITIGCIRIVTLNLSFILIGLFTPQSAAAINPQSIVGAWLFDEGKGDIAADGSVNAGKRGGASDLKLNHAAWVKGKFGTALKFNGQQRQAETSDEFLPGGLEPRTVAGWMKTGKSFNGFILNYGSHHAKFGPGREVHLGMLNKVEAGFFNFVEEPNAATVGVGGGENIPGQTRVNNGKWHHIAGSFDGLTWTLYVDGEVEGVGKPATSTKLNEGLSIGFAIGPGSWGFDGAIDEVVILNSALTQADVKSLLNGLEAAKAVSPSGKLATSWSRLKKRY